MPKLRWIQALRLLQTQLWFLLVLLGSKNSQGKMHKLTEESAMEPATRVQNKTALYTYI